MFRRSLYLLNTRPLIRKISHDVGQREIKEVTKIDESGKKTIFRETITTITQTWNSLTPLKKKLLCAYVAIGATDNLFGTYQSGRIALENYRDSLKTRNDYTHSTIKSEYQAVTYGCAKCICSRFIYSCIWPVSIIGRVMPSMVLYLNPSKESPNEPPNAVEERSPEDKFPSEKTP